MDEKEINILFEKITSDENVPEGTREVFKSLIDTTFKYRNDLVADGKPPLTVGEVEKGLTLLQEVASTGKLPKDMPERIEPLLERWLLALSGKQEPTKH